MYSFLSFLLLGGGQVPAGEGAEQVDPMAWFYNLLPLIAIIGIFYFLIIRPQSKKQKETKKMLEALKKGDKIVTIGGIHGVIQTVRESSVIVKVDESTKLEFARSAISSVITQAKEEEKKPEETGDSKEESSPDEK